MTTDFYATHQDLINLFAEFERQIEVNYVPVGQFSERPTGFPTSLAKIALTLPHGSDSDTAQLIFPRDQPVVVSEVPAFRRSPVRYAISHLNNEKSVTLLPGGEFGGVIVILGSVISDARRGWSRDTGRLLRDLIKKRWRKSDWLWLSPAAEKLWRSGWRLNRNIRNPTDTDFVPVAGELA